jgi:hypothetical protein
MKTIITFLLFSLALTLNVISQDVSKSKAPAREIRIDGKFRDWNYPFSFYIPEIEMRFEIANDKNNLYMVFLASDLMKMQKMFAAGWQVQLSTKEKGKKFSSKLTIPAVEFQEEPGSLALSTNPFTSFNIMVSKYKLQLAGIKAEGFKTKNGDLPLTDPNGISVGIASDSMMNLCYEIQIPLNELIPENTRTLQETLQLTVVLNAFKPKDDKKSPSTVSDTRTYAGMYGYVPNYSNYYGMMDQPEQQNEFFRDSKGKIKFVLNSSQK